MEGDAQSGNGSARMPAPVRAARDRVRWMAQMLDGIRDDLGLARREGADGRDALAELMAEGHWRLAERIAALSAEQERLLAAVQVAVDREPGQRERLRALRATPDYEVAFEEETPLVSVIVPTYDRAELLRERSLPSALAQTHERIEVIVVGDASPPEVAEAVESLGDERVRFHNLALRGPYPEDESSWFVAGVPPYNEGVRLARGRWIAPLDDDDAFTPDHVERLLEHAKATRAELAYGAMREHRPGGGSARVGEFPPRYSQFAMQAAIYHRGLAEIFELELSDAVFGEPYDWSLCRRMLRAGVRVSMLDAEVVEYYPSRVWAGRIPESGTEWEVAPEGVGAAQDAEAVAGTGWDVAAVAEAYRRKWPRFLEALEGPGALGVPHEVPEGVAMPREDPTAHNIVMSFGHVLALASRGRDELSVLDWGGSTGQYRELAGRLFDDLELDYHCKELPEVCAVGRELAPDVVFHSDDACLDRTYDLVLASGSLQYEDDWEALLGRLAEAAAPWLYVARMPVVDRSPTFAARQRAHAYGYDTEYVGWVLNRDELLAAAERAGLELVREFAQVGPMKVEGAAEDPRHAGWLWRAT